MKEFKINETKFATKAGKKEKMVGADQEIDLSSVFDLTPEKRKALREAISRRFERGR